MPKSFLQRLSLLLCLAAGLTAAAMTPSPALAAPGDLVPAFGTGGTDGDGVMTSTTSWSVTPSSIAIDSGSMYLIGNAGTSANNLVEKRRLDNGNLDPSFDGDGVVVSSAPASSFYDIVIDSASMYIVGFQDAPSTTTVPVKWRIEKRSLTTGSLSWAQTSNPYPTFSCTGCWYAAKAIAIDSTSMYVVGEGAEFGKGSHWRIEKRRLNDGTLDTSFDVDGVVISDPTTGDDVPYAIAIDSTYMYVGGRSNVVNGRWRLEKRRLDNGALDTSFNGDGIVETDYGGACGGNCTEPRAIAIDSTYMYTVGKGYGSYCDWRIEKRRLDNGNLDTSFDGDGVAVTSRCFSGTYEGVKDISIDSNYMYIVGGEMLTSPFGDIQWRIEKRNLSSGSLDVFFGVGGVVTNNPTSSADYVSDGVYVIAIDSTAMYVAGNAPSGQSSGWRIEKRESGGSPPPPPPTVNLSAFPTTINSGESTTLSWTTTDATSCDDVPLPEWISGPVGTSGSEIEWPTATTTYTISCTGPGGTTQQSTTVTVGSGSTWVEERITGAPGAERYPDIFGNLIVWDDNRDPGGGILDCVYGGNCDGGLFGWQISPSSNWQSEPAIDGSLVVWQELTATNWDIFIYDGIAQTLQITNNSAAQWYPEVSGNRVVWEDARNGPGDIYSCAYNQATNTCPEQQITTNPAGQASPAISGNLIVWMDFRGGFNPNVYVYELDTADEMPITAGGISWGGYPPAVSGNLIVWEASGNIYLCVYDSATNSCSVIKQITTDLSYQNIPAISGSRIVWDDGRNGNLDIYSCVYDQGTNTCPEEQVTTDPADQRFPSIDGNKVVWMDLRNDTGMGTNFDIYLASPSGGGGTPPPTVNLSAFPTTINSGESSTLSWTTTDATSCDDVPLPEWISGPVGASGSEVEWPTATTTYTISCTGAGGTSQQSATVTVSGGGGGACGVQAYDGTETINFSCEEPPVSPLRIRKDTTTYGIKLVDPADANASRIRIQTPDGVKALRKQ